MAHSLPPLPEHFEYRLDLAGHVTPRLLKDQPVHRWFYFPHSFSPQLVDLLLEEWHIQPRAWVLDPFVGAGTTLVAARERGLHGIGVDLSPLAVLASRVKTRSYDPRSLRNGLRAVQSSLDREQAVEIDRSERLRRAFTDAEFGVLVRLREAIIAQAEFVREFLLLALLRVQQQFSRAVADGGWFRWRDLPSEEGRIWSAFERQVDSMLTDITLARPGTGCYQVYRKDARKLDTLREIYPQLDAGCQAIITSPPYPNRHDYSRIFQIELLTLGLAETDIFSLRHESLRSNVEAQAPNWALPLFKPPTLLETILATFPLDVDARVAPMLLGYFEDMNAVLCSMQRILAPGGHVALVVGNVRHAGVMIPVDEILLQMGENLGFTPQTSWVARLRGNSAQQMGRFGRKPARESVVIMRT